jgi:hypothetical protein
MGAEVPFGPAASLAFGPDSRPCDVTRDVTGELTALTGTCTSVRVNDGCNRGTGLASFDATSLSFGAFRTTAKGCEFPPPVVFGENPIAWTIDGDLLTLTAADGHRVELTAAGEVPSPTTGPNPTTAPTSAPSPGPTAAPLTPDTGVGFPPASTDLTQGSDTWALVLAGSDDPSSSALAEAEDRARAAGYRTGPTDCDMGAADALGLPSSGGILTVSVYFTSEAEARQAQSAFEALGQPGGVVAQVQTYCLD